MEVSYTVGQVYGRIWPALRVLLSAKTEKGESPFDSRINYRLAKLARNFRDTVTTLEEQQKEIQKKHKLEPLSEADAKNLSTEEMKKRIAIVEAFQAEIEPVMSEKETFNVEPVMLPEESKYVSAAVLLDLDDMVTIHMEPVLVK